MFWKFNNLQNAGNKRITHETDRFLSVSGTGNSPMKEQQIKHFSTISKRRF